MEGKSRGRSARLRFQIASRREFERLKASDPKTLTDLERAARFLYLQRLAFGGKVAGRNFGIDRTQPARFNIVKLASTLEAIHERLSGVVIEQLPWRNFIDRYGRPGMLFYLDPPYWGVGGRLRQRRVRPVRVHRDGRTPGDPERAVSHVDQRHAGH
ncbi:hypothetical protein [Notoacmeibacter marinus]|uniref:hypothetical protein n=1 Tax=Notoacmeibacter marinus TaxID=1876515 RepID=UPI0019663971